MIRRTPTLDDTVTYQATLEGRVLAEGFSTRAEAEEWLEAFTFSHPAYRGRL